MNEHASRPPYVTHGPVRFFDRGSYQSLAGSGVAHVTGGEGSFSPTVAIALCSLTSAVGAVDSHHHHNDAP